MIPFKVCMIETATEFCTLSTVLNIIIVRKERTASYIFVGKFFSNQVYLN